MVAQDLADEAGVEDLISRLRPQIMIHLAAQSSAAQSQAASEATWRANVFGTFNLARGFARHGATDGLFLFTSTGDVYGSSCLAGPVDEAAPAAPRNAYALSKLAAEQILQDMLPPRTRLIITRAFNHSGAGHDERFVLPSFAAQIARAEAGETKPTISVGNLSARRDFLHVKDVVAAYVLLLQRSATLPPRTLVNIASGQPWAISDLLDLFLARASRPIEITTDPARMRPSDVPIMTGDASRLRNLTGWTPQLGVEQIVEDLLSAARAASPRT
jgi:GDP-4-dehydro-6-deoxy-D-mannose reductase